MKRLYSLIKFIILIAVIVCALSVLFYESTKDALINYGETGSITNLVNAYKNVREFVFLIRIPGKPRRKSGI